MNAPPGESSKLVRMPAKARTQAFVGKQATAGIQATAEMQATAGMQGIARMQVTKRTQETAWTPKMQRHDKPKIQQEYRHQYGQQQQQDFCNSKVVDNSKGVSIRKRTPATAATVAMLAMAGMTAAARNLLRYRRQLR
jgi:hypothetical protein